MAALVIAGATSVSRAGDARWQRRLADQLRNGPGVTNHPVGVVPSASMRIPADWPVGSDGAITCLTCHYQLPSPSGASPPCLRDFDEDGAEPADFCLNCHHGNPERTAETMHWMVVGVAHVKEDTHSDRRPGLLDADSRRCLECHDGVNANEAANTTPWNRGPGCLGDKRRNHPVGVRYSDRPSPQRSVQLRPVALLPANVRLPDGQVSCVSCHDLYATDQRRLTVPIEGSALCFTCHDMD
ncbi:MAG: cytochrome c3 family protein [Phycisphaerae bacterium]|nr:cytochrome c3 family protein [Phycisphaerae bacterium]